LLYGLLLLMQSPQMQNKAFNQLFKVACLCNNAVFDASVDNMATNIMARRVQGNVFYSYTASALY